MDIDWNLYQADVNRLYVQERKTADETLQHIYERYGTRIKIRQFKHRFGGSKTLKAREWKAIFLELDKRKALGIPSEVYIHGHHQSQTQLKRSFKLYYEKDSGSDISNVEIGIDTVGEHRIEIRRPAVVIPTQTDTEGLAVAMDIPEDPLEQNMETLVETGAMSPTMPPAFDMDDPAFARFNYNTPEMNTASLPWGLRSPVQNGMAMIDQSLVTVSSSSSYLTAWGHHDQIQGNSQRPRRSLSRNIFPSPDFNLHSPFDTLDLFNNSNRPYRTFWEMPEVSTLLRSLGCDGRASDGQRFRPTYFPSVPILRCTKGWLSSYLASIDPRLQTIQPMTDVVELFLVRDQEKAIKKIRLDSIEPKMFHCLLFIITYLISNNFMDVETFRQFVKWAFSGGHSERLLQILAKFPLGKDLIRPLLRSICAERSLLHHSRDHEFAQTYSREYPLLIQSINRHELSDSLGWDLLRTAVYAGHLEAVELLIERGINPNEGNSKTKDTPLAIAACHGLVEILEYLIAKGADVNKRSILANKDKLTVFEIAVKGGQLKVVEALSEAEDRGDLKLEFDAKRVLRDSTDRASINGLEMDFSPVSPLVRDQFRRKINALLVRRLANNEHAISLLMIQEAKGGPQSLSDFLMEKGRMDDEFLEAGLYCAVENGNVDAVATFLCRKVDANARKYRHSRRSPSLTTIPHPLYIALRRPRNTNIVYLLASSGARLDADDARFTGSRQSYGDLSILGPQVNFSTIPRNDSLYIYGTLLDAGYPIDAYTGSNTSMLQRAAKLGDLGLVQYLIFRGADFNLPACEDEGGRTALQAAVEGGHHDVANYLLQKGADIHAPPSRCNGITVLEAAALAIASRSRPYLFGTILVTTYSNEQQIASTFKKLLALGAPINRLDGESGILLHALSATEKWFEYLELALRQGASFESRCALPRSWSIGSELEDHASTPLQVASRFHNVEGMRLLIDRGASVNTTHSSDFDLTALQAALSYIPFTMYGYKNPERRQIQAVQLLLEHDADVNAPPSHSSGRTALQAACSREDPNFDIIQLLLSKGADVNTAPAYKGGVTALQAAAIRGHIHLVRLLLKHGADVNAPGAVEEGRTAVEGAAEHGRLDILRLLINNGALPDPVTGFSKAIQLAMDEERWSIVDFLESHQQRYTFLPLMHGPSEPRFDDGVDFDQFLRTT